ncbi:TetR/AcrR family transcriptional regulator [Krasilnikovia sp. MM14-A1004]|uniref:TetR/AcrR family transcriptional regulator n=1 Tax=Krasilnikovia sp. MM14-A1004 TaxID=3373541 RepID=UPI00399CCC5B
MPKKVDHQARRTLIADALMRVAAASGLEAVSLRHVAAEAGVTSGMVQHYFATKDEMMGFALSVIRERNEERVTRAVAALPQPVAPRALVRTILVELLPLDEQRRADGRVALAFLAYTAVRPEAAARMRDDTDQMVAFIADQIRAAQASDDSPAGLNPEHLAAGLLAAMEGLGVYLLGGQYDAQTAVSALDDHLSLIFTG